MVTRLRKEHHIDKQSAARQYQAVEDPPMGKQLQVDFGETTVQSASSGHCKIYGMELPDKITITTIFCYLSSIIIGRFLPKGIDRSHCSAGQTIIILAAP
jgi:hypothetical protein